MTEGFMQTVYSNIQDEINRCVSFRNKILLLLFSITAVIVSQYTGILSILVKDKTATRISQVQATGVILIFVLMQLICTSMLSLYRIKQLVFTNAQAALNRSHKILNSDKYKGGKAYLVIEEQYKNVVKGRVNKYYKETKFDITTKGRREIKENLVRDDRREKSKKIEVFKRTLYKIPNARRISKRKLYGSSENLTIIGGVCISAVNSVLALGMLSKGWKPEDVLWLNIGPAMEAVVFSALVFIYTFMLWRFFRRRLEKADAVLAMPPIIDFRYRDKPDDK